MTDRFEIGDIFAAVNAWEIQRSEFLNNLLRAKQPEPSPEAMENFKEVFIESFLKGRNSK
jgi:hypothetical protein